MDPDLLLAAIRRVVDLANGKYSANIALEPGRQSLPYAAFLYPLGDTYFTGRAPRKGRPTLDRKKQGGHHLSPLSPTPWIQALIGLWSPSQRIRTLPPIPSANCGLKAFLLDLLGPSPRIS
jgi:hypothetical protein